MLVPDQSHIDRVRDALWQHSGGGASVMVGSGFSRNALKTRPDATDIPMWHTVARAMYNKLYPQSQRDEIAEPSATDGFLRLAQEYKTAFGPSALYRFLQQLVRDDDFMPGDRHIQLLSLPWRDVFTTNWDTLLERTRASVVDHAYSVVRKMDEIPLANRPRIVKLHGSFPTDSLIFTEEDYRTYPTKFAPFVNMVQQAMMESVFCLIGFSANDPNFLHWSGWVRDNLGTAAPKVYLAGWLNLSPHRRRMLEDRNVAPIDLAHHPKAKEWPEHLRHGYATEWILHTLERGPYKVTAWPFQRSQQYSSIPEYLQPVQGLVSEYPQKETIETPRINSKDLPKRVKQTLDIWTHNRNIYPNWLTVPASSRELLSLCTDEWESLILHVLPDFTPVEQLNSIFELVWRREILLDPISSQLESAAEEALKPIDCQTRTIEDIAHPEIKWASIRETWRTIALALVTVARHRFDRDVFNQRIEALSPFLDDDSDIVHRIYHERCLWAVYSMDFKGLDGLLKDWQTENCDPVWMMRKAALLTETGWDDEGTELTKHALATIRKMPADDRSVAGPSREGWALYSTWPVSNREMILRRWDELTPLKCNASLEKDHIKNAIKGDGETEEASPFDLGMRQGTRFRISNDEYKRWVSVRRAIRLSEVAGLPPSVFKMAVAADILKLAADELLVFEPEMAVRLVLRTVDYEEDALLMRVLSRTRVATLSPDLARTLAEICKDVIEYVLPQMAGTGRHKRSVSWIQRIPVAMEALSRLVLRLEPDMVEDIFDKAVEYYRNHQVAQKPWLTNPVRSVLERSWEALPEDRRTTRVLDLLSAPIVGMDNFMASESRYLDPGELLQNDLPLPVRTEDNEDRWQEIVSLLVRGLRTGGEARKRACLRIVPMAFWERLTESESSQVTQALWSEKYTGLNDLPGETLLPDWMFLLLPEPESGLSEQRFRRKWLTANSTPQENAHSADDILWQVGIAISGLKNHQRSLGLSEEERFYLIEAVEQWSDTPVPSQFFDPFEDELRRRTVNTLKGLSIVITEILIPEDIGEKLYKKVQSLNESEIPGFGLIAGLVKAMPNRVDELASMIRTGLGAESEDLAKGAAAGIYHWLTTSAEITAQSQPPPDDLVREIGVMIATRRKACLEQALQIAKWVFDEGSDTQKEDIRHLTLQGLSYLVEELRYDREHDRDEDIDVPLLRWRCAQLALSMATHESASDPTVFRWLEIVEEDPLPEVRYAKRPAFVRRLENVGGRPNLHTGEWLAVRLRATFEANPLEDGKEHPAERIIEEVLGSEENQLALGWFSTLCLDEAHPSFAASVLRCLGRQAHPGTVSWRTGLVRDALAMNDIEIRDAAVQAAELWGDQNLRSVLESHSESEPWLREYIQDVIDGLVE